VSGWGVLWVLFLCVSKKIDFVAWIFCIYLGFVFMVPDMFIYFLLCYVPRVVLFIIDLEFYVP